MGFSRQEYWPGFPCPLLGDLPNPVIKPGSPELQANSSPLRHLYWTTSILLFSHSVTSQRFVTPWTAAHQACLSLTISWSLLKLVSIESVMPSNHLILCQPLLLPPSVFPSIRIFSNESVLHIRWPKYWGFSFSISPSNEHSGLISFRMDWLDLLAVQGMDSQEPPPTPQLKSINSSVLSLFYGPALT